MTRWLVLSALVLAVSDFGVASSQLNNPRQIQLALKLFF
jgi:hypothetical protein